MESAVATTTKKSGRHPHVGNLSTLDVQAAIAEIASGTLSKQIAARYNVLPKTLRDYLKRHDPEGYAAAVVDQAESMVEDATEYAIGCADKEDAPIARVRMDAAHNWAKARDPSKWMPKQQIDLAVTVDLGDRLRRALERDCGGNTDSAYNGQIVKCGNTTVEGQAQLVDDSKDAPE